MNRYILIRRLKGPAILLLIGTIALLHQAGLASWNLFVPLLLILIGVLLLAERAVLASMDYPSQNAGMYSGGYPGGYPGAYPGQAWGAPPAGSAPSTAPSGTSTAQPGSGIVRTNSQGGQS